MSCSGCGRVLMTRPNSICPNVVHWRAWSEEVESELKQARDWEDVDDEWTEAIDAAFPTRSGSHDEYATARKMIGHRHSKGQLVALVNWLLVRLKSRV